MEDGLAPAFDKVNGGSAPWVSFGYFARRALKGSFFSFRPRPRLNMRFLR